MFDKFVYLCTFYVFFMVLIRMKSCHRKGWAVFNLAENFTTRGVKAGVMAEETGVEMKALSGENGNVACTEESLASGEKSKNQLKNEKKKEEKMAKFLAKKEKMASTAAPKAAAKPKTLAVKLEDVEDNTIPGEKKGIRLD